MKVRNKRTGEVYMVKNFNAKMLVYGEVVEGYVTLGKNKWDRDDFIVSRHSLDTEFEEYREHIPSYGDLMTLEEFWECLESQYISDDDGSGEWVDGNDCIIESNKSVTDMWKSSDGWVNVPEGAVKVIWYNK